MTKAVRRGEVWAVDSEPQTHRQEPGKKERLALVIQTDALNKAGHPTTIVIPGTSQVDALPPPGTISRCECAFRKRQI